MDPAQNNDVPNSQPQKAVPDGEPVSLNGMDSTVTLVTESAADQIVPPTDTPAVAPVITGTTAETTPPEVPDAAVAGNVIQPSVVPADSVPAAETVSPAGLSTLPSAGPATDTAVAPPATNEPVALVNDESQSPVVGGLVTSGGLRKSRKKLFLFGGIPFLLVLLLTGGWVFGMYLPNRPENVWKTGFDRTGQALDAVVSHATSAKSVASLKKSELTGDITYKSKDSGTVSGNFNAKLDDVNSDSSLNVTFKPGDEPSTKITAKVLTMKTDKKAVYPDIYFQVAGFKSLGLDGLLPGINQYDGKWIAVSGDYLNEQINSETGTSEEAPTSPTVAETTAALKAVSGTVREYFLTSDPAKAVVTNKGFTGKETVDGVATYRYKAGINKQNGKQYCKALGTTIASTDVFKKLVAEKNRDDRKKSIVSDCQDSVNAIKDSDTFDLWIDAHYKLIHKIRVYDADNTKSYTEVGQHYTGGDTVDLFLNVHDSSEKMDATATTTLNFKDYSLKGSAEAKSTNPAYAYTMSSHFSGKASDGKVDVTKPAGAIDVRDVLSQIEAQANSQVSSDNSFDTCDANPNSGACAPDPNIRTN